MTPELTKFMQLGVAVTAVRHVYSLEEINPETIAPFTVNFTHRPIAEPQHIAPSLPYSEGKMVVFGNLGRPLSIERTPSNKGAEININMLGVLSAAIAGHKLGYEDIDHSPDLLTFNASIVLVHEILHWCDHVKLRRLNVVEAAQNSTLSTFMLHTSEHSVRTRTKILAEAHSDLTRMVRVAEV